MKSLRGILVAAACALATLPVRAAIELAESVDYLQGATPDAAGCTWEADMASAAVASSRNAITASGQRAAATGTKLSLQVAQLKRVNTARGGEYAAVVRANVVQQGKLLATRDFQDEASFKKDRPACDALRALGVSMGEAVADWASQTRFMKCGEDCLGIHPDEPIVMGAQILLGVEDAINDTVRDGCRWQTVMVGKVAAAFNEADPPPRAKLEARAIEIEKYPGRRLVLRVNNVHALGGGGFTGPKWMEMSGELWDGRSLVGSFHSYTSSGRGLTTCRSVDSLSDSTADMIAQWLQSPSLDADLK